MPGASLGADMLNAMYVLLDTILLGTVHTNKDRWRDVFLFHGLHKPR